MQPILKLVIIHNAPCKRLLHPEKLQFESPWGSSRRGSLRRILDFVPESDRQG